MLLRARCDAAFPSKITTGPEGSLRGFSGTPQSFRKDAVLTIQFGPFELDLDTRQLKRDGVELHLSPKAFELLATLVADRPKALSKDVLHARLWPKTFVVEANLSNLVGEIRDVLGDQARAPRFIRTAHRFGYAFCADATTGSDSGHPVSGAPARWLEWGRHRFPLPVGEHVIGRDPDVAIRLDRSTVSRRHARLVVTAEETLLEDVASKNGTFRGNDRITSRVVLANGDAIRIGALLVTFHVGPLRGSTETHLVEATP